MIVPRNWISAPWMLTTVTVHQRAWRRSHEAWTNFWVWIAWAPR